MNDEVDLEPSDTFSILSQRTRSLRAKREHVEWASVSVEFHGVPIKTQRSYGEARIDQSLFRSLGGGQPTSFRVEPGPHKVTVHLSRWLRLPRYRRSSKLSIDVVVQPGEELRLVCGLRPGAVDQWKQIQIAGVRPVLLFSGGALVVAGVVWFLFGMIGRLIAPANVFIQIRGGWISPVYTLSVFMTIVYAGVAVGYYVAANRLILAPNRRILQSLSYRFEYPYFLKKAEDPLDGRQPARSL